MKKIFSQIMTRIARTRKIFDSLDEETPIAAKRIKVPTNQEKDTHMRFQGATQRIRADMNAPNARYGSHTSARSFPLPSAARRALSEVMRKTCHQEPRKKNMTPYRSRR